jgi:hypothetical protein
LHHTEAESLVGVPVLVAALLVECLIDQRYASEVVVQPLIVDEVGEALDVVAVVLDEHDVRLATLVADSALLGELDLDEPVLVALCVRELLSSGEQVHLLLLVVVHIAGDELLDVLQDAERLDVEDLLEHVEEEHGGAVHQHEDLLLDVLGLPDVQFLEVEDVFL